MFIETINKGVYINAATIAKVILPTVEPGKDGGDYESMLASILKENPDSEPYGIMLVPEGSLSRIYAANKANTEALLVLNTYNPSIRASALIKGNFLKTNVTSKED
jgi:hypothetical protein